MQANDIRDFFVPLYSDIKEEDQFYRKRPLLAHYTSLETLESIVRTNEIWLSNPLFMNDLEEVRFGIANGVALVRENQSIASALQQPHRRRIFLDAFNKCVQSFEENHAFDTYVFCFSEHPRDNTDGLLSMWRGYGGNGKGVALVFDSANLGNPTAVTPLILASVHYGTKEERLQWLSNMCEKAAGIITQNYIPDEHLAVAGECLFDRIKLFSLFTKHIGFEEEHEWRVVYRVDLDEAHTYSDMFGYVIGKSGVEPKLKIRLVPIPNITSDDFSLEKLLSMILLGPSASTVLAQLSVKRMLGLQNRTELIGRVRASTIPLRP